MSRRWRAVAVSLRSAAIKLDQTNYSIKQATLTSPIDGKVVLLNYKVGDIILQSEAEAMATIINENTLFIEVNIEEADISKVEVGQKANIIFEALDDLELDGTVSFISMTSQTSNNGIVTYQVRVVLENPSGSKIREGMSAAVEFLTGEAENVLYVPVQAVKNVDGSASVKSVTGEWIKVTTGFTDGKYVEIKNGLEENVKIYY
jgi:HlyD family secretion protein